MYLREIKQLIREKKDVWSTLTPMQQQSFLDELIRELDEAESQIDGEMSSLADNSNG